MRSPGSLVFTALAMGAIAVTVLALRQGRPRGEVAHPVSAGASAPDVARALPQRELASAQPAAPQGAPGRRVEASGPPAETSLTCRVRSNGEAVAWQGALHLQLGGLEIARAGVDPAGRAVFRDLPPGRYRIRLGSRLSERFLLAREDRSAWMVELAPGEERTVDLALELSCALEGFVFGRDGGTVPGVAVRLHAQDSRLALGTVETDERGSYRWSGLYPGGYRARVELPAALSAECGIAPPSAAVHLHVGRTTRVDFHLSAEKTATVRGRVLDADGQAFSGLRLLCLPMEAGGLDASTTGAGWIETIARTATDTEGRFELKPVPRRPLLIQIDPRELQPDARSGLRTISRPIPPLAVLPDSDSVNVPDIVAVRPESFVLEGRLVGNDPAADTTSLEAVYIRSDAHGRTAEWTVPLPLDGQGNFAFECQTFDRPVSLRLAGRDGRTLERLDPQPGVRSVRHFFPR